MMQIEFHKFNQDKHRLKITRLNRTTEERELETRSFLLHDLTHFAIESEAKIRNGFWGLLSQNTSFEMLYDKQNGFPENKDLEIIESLVGPMQSLWNGRLSKEFYLKQGREFAPHIVSEGFVDAVLERLRKLMGEWNDTRYGESMKLEWLI